MQEQTLYFSEVLNDTFGYYTCYWFCPVPDRDVTFRVTREDWNEEYTERWIYEIQEIR